MDNKPDYLPLSYLNHLAYCERRFWLMYVQAEMDINAAVLEGTQQHQRAHVEGTVHEGDTTIHRRLYLWSDRFKIVGFADVIEEQPGELIPVEYKRGRIGRWANDQIQLCAQALCLEERTSQTINRGEIFYWRSRRRERVAFTPELRLQTEATIERAYQLLAAGQMPLPIDHRAKCRDCSLEGICLPREVLMLQKE